MPSPPRRASGFRAPWNRSTPTRSFPSLRIAAVVPDDVPHHATRRPHRRHLALLGLAALLVSVLAGPSRAQPVGEPVRWQPLQLDFTGPFVSETGVVNPFRDYRLDVTFVHTSSGISRLVPGYFAADGAAADSSATAGDVWRVHFTPNRPGPWTWTASFRTGNNVALSLSPNTGVPTSFDGASGSFDVAPTDPDAPGFLSQGRLRWTGQHHLRFAATNTPYLKAGADSPENLLAFADFDATPPTHAYPSHVADWKPGDPTWGDDRGHGLIGALNYLAGMGMNSVYFLTFNVSGDGDDVWPWTGKFVRDRFDCSKLDQWERVFSHMDRLGLVLHVVTQETENDNGSAGLDNGELGAQRMLYYRELVARFSHHLGLIWNIGEENSNTTEQQAAFIQRIRALDAYDHPMVVHTFATAKQQVWDPLLELDLLEGAAMQNVLVSGTHLQTLIWRERSAAAGRPWFVTLDEFGPSSDGVIPDFADPLHDEVRRQGLWGNLIAGGAGCEWYFGYAWPNDDLDCEDWRSRESLWELTANAVGFFTEHLPFDEMEPQDERVLQGTGWCLARPGQVYAVYLPDGGPIVLDLGDTTDTFTVRWFDPVAGGDLQVGTVAAVTGPDAIDLGAPPGPSGQDWAIVVKRRLGLDDPEVSTEGEAVGPEQP